MGTCSYSQIPLLHLDLVVVGICVDPRALPRPFGDICSCTALTLQTRKLRVCRERKTECLP